MRSADDRADVSFEPYLQEYRMCTADGGVVWVRDEAIHVPGSLGTPAHWIGLVVDITERKRFESSRDRRSRSSGRSPSDPAVVYIEEPAGSGDSPIYISPKYEELLGYTPEERQARPTLWRELLHPKTATACSRPQGAYDRPFSEDYRMIARDGRVVWVHDVTVPIRTHRARSSATRASSTTSPSRSGPSRSSRRRSTWNAPPSSACAKPTT